MKRIIITGAAGFIGANLTRRLLREGYDIHLLLRHGFKNWRILDVVNDVNIHKIELCDDRAVKSIVEIIKPDWIFHLAAYGSYPSETDFHTMVHTNIRSTANLVEACAKTGFEIFVNTGTSSEFGFKDHPPSEKEFLEPNSPYAVTKSSQTLFCQYVARKYNVNIITLRLYSVYGPYEEPSRLIPTLIVNGLSGRLPLLVDPNTVHDYVYIDDVVNAYLLAATQNSISRQGIYNVGTGIQTSLREVVGVAKKLMKITDEPCWGSMPNRTWDTSRAWVSDSRKIQSQLGWRSHHNLEQGFQKTIEWFRDQSYLYPVYQKIIK